MDNQQRHAVALFFFNRKDCLLQVASRIIDADPPAVYLIADGPRSDVEGEFDLCMEVRGLVESLPWKCPIHKVYSDINLGCGLRVSSGVSEVLKHEESVIVLEDDTLPHQDFFPYCDELLSYYQNDESVFMISGLQFKEKISSDDSIFTYEDRDGYTFEFNCGIWGWATWRRAWRHYIFDMSNYTHEDQFWMTMCPIRTGNSMEESLKWRADIHYSQVMEKGFPNAVGLDLAGTIDTWDSQWHLCLVRHRAYCISPNWNLVENIGFGADSTHLTGSASCHWAGEYRSYPFKFPMKHPIPGILSTAIHLMNNGDLNSAIEYAQKGIDRYPQELRLHTLLATLAHSLGNLSLASEACNNALQIDPGNSRATRILDMIPSMEKGIPDN